MSDTEPEDDLDDNDDEGILNAFTAIVDPTDGVSEIIDDEEDLVDSKFEKMNDQDDIHTTYEKLYKIIFLRSKLAFVGNAFEHAFHKKCLSFPGTLAFHNFFQNP